ncbi:chemotaxis protein CheW [Kaarinaea lacus]
MGKQKANKKVLDDCWNTIGVWGSSAEKCERLDQVVHCRNCDIFSQAGREVLERKPPAGYVTQWKNEIAHQQEDANPNLAGVITFRLGNEWFAIQANSLQEIAELRTIHHIPHNSNPYIAGVVNIGGEISACYSLGRLLGVDRQGTENSTYQRLIVVNYQDEAYIFPVSEVTGMTRYSETDIIPAPATLDSERLSLIDNMIVYKKKHIAILNVEQICRSLGRIAA